MTERAVGRNRLLQTPGGSGHGVSGRVSQCATRSTLGERPRVIADASRRQRGMFARLAASAGKGRGTLVFTLASVGAGPPNHEDWTPYAPDPAPANAGVCSWCGHRQTPDCLVVISGDGTAGICENCVAGHGRFFARRHSSPPA
jgi:hypothetical protein